MSTTISRAPAAVADGTREAAVAGYGLAVLRIVAGVTFLHEAAWKIPPTFGQFQDTGLWEWANFAIEHPVFPPYTAVVQAVVLPAFPLFGWAVFLLEAALGGFLIVGLHTRLWGALGVVQSLAIALSVLNVPGEWAYAYYLFTAGLIAVTLGAGGRRLGLDQVLRPRWAASGSPLARLALRLS